MMKNQAFLAFCCLAVAIGLAWGIFFAFITASPISLIELNDELTPGQWASLMSIVYVFTVVLMPPFFVALIVYGFPSIYSEEDLFTRVFFFLKFLGSRHFIQVLLAFFCSWGVGMLLAAGVIYFFSDYYLNPLCLPMTLCYIITGGVGMWLNLRCFRRENSKSE